MSLATRCPACGTTFKVVQDQLKVSEGWVRCGQCHEVFNALESLFELPAAPSPDGPPPVPSPTAASGHPRPVLARARPETTDLDLAEPAPLAPPTDARPVEPPAPLPPAGWTAPPMLPPAPETAAQELSAPAVDMAAAPGEPPDPATPPDALADPAPLPDMAAVETALEAHGLVASAAEPDGPSQNPTSPDPTTRTAHETPLALPPEPEATSDAVPIAAPITVAVAADPAEVEDQAEPDVGPLSEYESSDGTRTQSPTPAWGPSQGWAERRQRRRSSRPQRTAPPPLRDPAGIDLHPETAPPVAMDPLALSPPRQRTRRRKPEFMRQVERAAQWQRPAVRAVLASTALVLGLLLTGQIAWQHRDTLAAQWPVAGQAVARACAPWGCRILAPAQLESLVLENSQLLRTPWPDTLRLSLALRNTAAHAVRTPAVELSFTDDQGRLLARRVLPAEDWNPPAPAAIDADGVWRLDQLIQVGPLAVSGYTTEVFYP